MDVIRINDLHKILYFYISKFCNNCYVFKKKYYLIFICIYKYIYNIYNINIIFLLKVLMIFENFFWVLAEKNICDHAQCG